MDIIYSLPPEKKYISSSELMRARQGRAKHQASCGVAMWQWLINSAATSVVGTFSPSPCSVGASLTAGTGPVVGCLLPTHVVTMPQRLQVEREKHSGEAGWDWGTDLPIRRISILTPLSHSSALPPNSLSRAGGSVNSVIYGRWKTSRGVSKGHGDWMGEFPLHLPLPSQRLPERMHIPMRSILSR